MTQECVVYVRLSQDQKGTEEGIDRQLAECREWCAARGWTIREVYADNDLSATKDNVVRPRFEALLVDLKASPVPVVCWHTDRFLRKLADLMRVIALNVNVHGLNSGHFDLSTPAGRAVAVTVTAWATYEGEQKSLRQKSSHAVRAKKGKAWWMNRPFGYNMDGTLHPRESKALADIYDQVLAGLSISGACRELTAQGFTTTLGKAWRAPSLRQVLLAPRNAAIATYNGEEVGPAQWTPIISEGTFRATVRLLTSAERRTPGPRKGRGGRNSVLVGFATCGVCEGPTRSMRRGEIRYYGCVKGHASARQDWVDERVGLIIADRLTSDDYAASELSASDNPDVDAMATELAELRRDADELAEMLGAREMTRAQFATANKLNMDRTAELERALASTRLDRTLHDLLDIEDFETHWRTTMTLPRKHTVVTHLFDRIVIHPRGKASNGAMQRGDVHFFVKGYPEPIM